MVLFLLFIKGINIRLALFYAAYKTNKVSMPFSSGLSFLLNSLNDIFEAKLPLCQCPSASGRLFLQLRMYNSVTYAVPYQCPSRRASHFYFPGSCGSIRRNGSVSMPFLSGLSFLPYPSKNPLFMRVSSLVSVTFSEYDLQLPANILIRTVLHLNDALNRACFITALNQLDVRFYVRVPMPFSSGHSFLQRWE